MMFDLHTKVVLMHMDKHFFKICIYTVYVEESHSNPLINIGPLPENDYLFSVNYGIYIIGAGAIRFIRGERNQACLRSKFYCTSHKFQLSKPPDKESCESFSRS